MPWLERIDARDRLRFLDREMAHAAYRARFWAWSWAGIYSALTVGSAILTATASDESGRIDNGIGTAASFVGLAVLIVKPLDIMRDQRWLERRLRLARPDEDTCALLADAERLLIRDAASEAFGSGPLVHVGTFGFNIALVLLLGVGFGHWNAAVSTGVTGIAVGEIQALTQPTDAVRLLRDYRRGWVKRYPPKPATTWMVVPTAGRDHYGLSFALSF
jgi:hypothetical protein